MTPEQLSKVPDRLATLLETDARGEFIHQGKPWEFVELAQLATLLWQHILETKEPKP